MSKRVKDSTEINPHATRIVTHYDPILGFCWMDFFKPFERSLSKKRRNGLR